MREAELAVDRRANPVGLAVKVMRSAVLTAESVGSRREEPPVPPAVPTPSPPEREGLFIERGPTRADPALEAWCSFCCRPRTEVGPLVAGPAGAFICAACIGESSSLLGGVTARAASARPRASRPVTQELLGQAEARARLESGLAAGGRRVLVLGPEGSGKSTGCGRSRRRGRARSSLRSRSIAPRWRPRCSWRTWIGCPPPGRPRSGPS
ncbi:ClpX C4-type zinc finger protein [Cystobacter fuscus]